MTLQNFENLVESKILARGKAYFKSGYILSLEYEDDEWVAEVDGSDEYTVSVNISKEGEILSTFCDCPYDWGDYCKHQAAVFYALRDKGILNEKSAMKSAKKENLEEILSKLDKQTLVALIIEYANTYKPMKSEIKFRYAQKADVLKSARQVIRSAVKAVERRGFVEYRDVRSATEGANTVLQMAEDKINSNELLTAVSLAFIVAEEMMELMNNCDDSNGYAGGAVSEAVEKIGDAIIVMPKNYADSKKIFNAVFDHALSGMYDGWTDWRMDLLSTLVPLCSNKANREQMEKYLSVPENSHGSDFIRGYDVRVKQKLQYEIICKFDGDDAANVFVEKNLDNIDFRRMAIISAITSKNYDRAIALCIEGENSNQQYPGIVKDLQTLRYTVYEATNNKPEQKTLALALLLNGEFDYFLKYKSLHSKDEWVTALYDVLEKTEERDRRGIYVEILVHEKHKPRLLAFCKKMPSAIARYHTHLLPEYKQEVGQLFSEHIRHTAARADSRTQYSEVCQLIETCEKACPGATDSLCAEIIEKNARRPAFMDEMRKIGKH
ncbi:MAG: SWIM zinc finger family protein [Defluviitaleaceae bacterium]|nr:SWIM zinc finger family protein [Defluviitaleaceae bacterium]